MANILKRCIFVFKVISMLTSEPCLYIKLPRPDFSEVYLLQSKNFPMILPWTNSELF